MKSRITIEVDFDTALPYIRVIQDRLSDDVRDKLITQFRHKLGEPGNLNGFSDWCRVRFDEVGLNGHPLFTIEPIIPQHLEGELEIMKQRIEYIKNIK